MCGFRIWCTWSLECKKSRIEVSPEQDSLSKLVIFQSSMWSLPALIPIWSFTSLFKDPHSLVMSAPEGNCSHSCYCSGGHVRSSKNCVVVKSLLWCMVSAKTFWDFGDFSLKSWENHDDYLQITINLPLELYQLFSTINQRNQQIIYWGTMVDS